MFTCGLNLVIKKDKIQQFNIPAHSLLVKFKKEKGCHDYRLYRDFEKEDTFFAIGTWETQEAMEDHFRNRHFTILIGAAKILSSKIQMDISGILESGGFELAKSKVESRE